MLQFSNVLKINFVTIFICLIFCPLNSFAQPLTNGMGIITHWTGFDGGWDAFSIYETENNASAPLGQNWETNFIIPNNPAVHASWKGTNMGDVFGITIDAEKNVYFSATKSISSSGSTGTSAGVAGDGGVYKMDANTWIVSPFIFSGNGTNEIPNQGNGLGNIAYDKWNNQLFITNFEDGKIYRFDMQGNLLSTFDPFNVNTTELGVFSGHGEALWGINIYGDNEGVKVYFSLWTEDNSLSDASGDNNSVWSIDLDASGDFTGNENLCFTLEDNTGSFMGGIVGASYPISDIAFSSDGKMYVCEKVQGGWGAFSGWNDPFTPGAHSSRLFEYQKINNVWTPTIKYAVGNYNTPNDADNTTGGVALGNKQLSNGEIECEKIIWASGDALRFSGFNDLAGQEYVYGLTGIPIEGNSNDPSDADYVQLSSIYIDVDYTGTGSNGGQKMSYGDIEIYSDAVSEANFTISPNTTICPGTSVQLNVSGGTNYEWSPSATLDDNTSDSPTASPTENTIYTVTGEGSCGGRDTVSVNINIDDFTFSLGPDLAICEGISDVSLDAGNNAIAYIWNTGQTSQIISVNNEGIYNVTVTSPSGCNYNDDVLVQYKLPPTVVFSTLIDSLCPPGNFTLIDESIPQEGDPILSWNWEINSQNFNTSSTNVNLANSGSYEVSLEVITELGCIATLSLDNYLTVHDVPSPNFITEPEEINNCDKTIKLINLSSGYDSLSWNFGDGVVSSEDTTDYYTYSEVGNYIIQLNLVNEFGCENVLYREINPIASIPFYAPNAFTPDGDELNETFIPQLGCSDDFEFWVMNRWGEVIFYSNDINVGWDGTYNKQRCPPGVYSWKARYNGAKTNQIKLGEVHLMN